MRTSAKNYTKKKTEKQKKQTARTLRQMVKAKLYRQTHTKKHTHIHSQKEEKEIYIYIFTYIYIYIKEESNQINEQIYQR